MPDMHAQDTKEKINKRLDLVMSRPEISEMVKQDIIDAQEEAGPAAQDKKNICVSTGIVGRIIEKIPAQDLKEIVLEFIKLKHEDNK